jgi:LemA protein
MKKYLIWIILGVLVLFSITSYNGLVGSRESVNKAWANVETQYQRRADLIPNLVNTVKGAAEFEKSTLTAVMEARAQATSVRIDPNNITPEKLREFQAAQSQVGGALSRLLAVAENYPQLKAVESFNQLQAQLEGTENRITESRRQFNEAAQAYNASRTKFPRVIFANIFGFPSKPYFESDKGSEKAPEVKF